MFETFRDIIDLWPSPETLAGELGAKPGTVRKWRQRDNIPAEWWLLLIEKARSRGYEIPVEALATLAARQKADAAA